MAKNKQILYVLKDNIADIYKYPAFCNSDAEYVRIVLTSCPVFPSECTLYKCDVPLFKKEVSFDSYKFPESPMEAFKPLGMSEGQLNEALKNTKARLDKINNPSIDKATPKEDNNNKE